MPMAVLRKESEKPLPHHFAFPANYHPEVEMCLKSGKMTTKAWKHFLSAIASCMFSYKWYVNYVCEVLVLVFMYRYPTKEEFIQVALEIIRKYPFMKSLTGTPLVGFMYIIIIYTFYLYIGCHCANTY